MTLSAERLFAEPCDFVAGGVDLNFLPPMHYPEVAFAGRSNVGKSSLVNALTGRRTLAHASSMPGRTKEINFFLLAKRLMLVDLPGYGYAKASKEDVAKWTALVQDYLAGRPNLKRVCLLIDSRHGLKDSDHGVMKQLDIAAVSYLVTLTKIDKIKAAELEKVKAETEAALKKHPAAIPHLIATSAEKSDGIKALRLELASFARKNPL